MARCYGEEGGGEGGVSEWQRPRGVNGGCRIMKIGGEKEGSGVLTQMTEEDEMNGWDKEG